MNEVQILQLTTLIRDGIPASRACGIVGITQSALTRRLVEARRASKGATEDEKAGQRYYKLLLAYEDAQRQRSKTLRKLRGHPEEKKMALERHPLVYRNLLTLPVEIKEKIFEHIAHGSWAADAAESEKIHASIMQLWLERGLTAFVSDQEDEESATYLDFYLGVLSAFARARTSASERIHTDSPLSYLLYGPGRESDERQGYLKNPRVVPQAAKQPLVIETRWATSKSPPTVVHGKLEQYKVQYPEGYEPPDRTDWPSEDEN